MIAFVTSSSARASAPPGFDGAVALCSTAQRRMIARQRAPPYLQRHVKQASCVRMCASSSAVQELVGDQTEIRDIDLQNGVRMKYYHIKASGPEKAPLLFIHGTFHAGWCWARYFMPYFASRGYPCYAISLRGTSETMAPDDDSGAAITVDSHVQDGLCFLESVIQKPVILVGHSFGGLYVQKLLETRKVPVKAAVSVCSVPPDGNSRMVGRFFRDRGLGNVIKITLGLLFKKAASSPKVCQELFFSTDDDMSEIEKYMARFKTDSRRSLDVRDLQQKLPSLQVNPASQRVAWIEQDPIPVMVCGATQDCIVDLQGVEETARFFGVEPIIFEGLPHDVMLTKEWERAARAILDFLESVQ